MKDPNQTSAGPLAMKHDTFLGAVSQDFSGQVPRNDGQEPGQADTTLHKVNLPGERGTRKLKVFDGAMIEQLLGTRTGY